MPVLISEFEKELAEIKRTHGDIEIVAVEAPFGTGETEVLTSALVKVSAQPPANGVARTKATMVVGKA